MRESSDLTPSEWLRLEPTEHLLEELIRRHPLGAVMALETEMDDDGDFHQIVSGDPNVCAKLCLILQWQLQGLYEEANE